MGWYTLARNYFLSDPDLALAWAMENVDLSYSPEDLEEAEERDRDYIAAILSQYMERATSYSDMYNEVIFKSSVTLYRALVIKVDPNLPHHEGNVRAINWDNLGTHWSFKLDRAGPYGFSGSDKGMVNIVIKGSVSPGSIDWEYGFTSFMYYGEDQWECALDDDAPIKVTHLGDQQITPINTKA